MKTYPKIHALDEDEMIECVPSGVAQIVLNALISYFSHEDANPCGFYISDYSEDGYKDIYAKFISKKKIKQSQALCFGVLDALEQTEMIDQCDNSLPSLKNNKT